MHDRQHLEHVFRRVAVAPRRGRVHRVVRIREAHPAEERTVDVTEPFAGAVGDPRGEVLLLGEPVRPGLAVVPLRTGRLGLHEPEPLVAALVAVAEQYRA